MSLNYIDKLKREFASGKQDCVGGCCNAPVNMTRLNPDAYARSNIPIRDIKPVRERTQTYQESLPTPQAELPLGDALLKVSTFDKALADMMRQTARDREAGQESLAQFTRDDPTNLLEFFQENARKEAMKARLASLYGQNLTDDELADEIAKLHRGEKGSYVGRMMKRSAMELGVALPAKIEKRLDDVEARVLGDKPRTDRDAVVEDAVAGADRFRPIRPTPLLGAGGEEETKTMDAEDFGEVSAPLMTATASGNPFRGAIDVEPDDELARAIGAQASRLRAFEARASPMPLRFRAIPSQLLDAVGARLDETEEEPETRATPEPMETVSGEGTLTKQALLARLRGRGYTGADLSRMNFTELKQFAIARGVIQQPRVRGRRGGKGK